MPADTRMDAATENQLKTTVISCVQTVAEANAEGGWPASQRREEALAKALRAMASLLGTTLQDRKYIDSRGDFSVFAQSDQPTGFREPCGSFSQEFCDWLNKHNPRTGVNPGAHIAPPHGWCWQNHFDTERMVTAFAQTLTPSNDPEQAPTPGM